MCHLKRLCHSLIVWHCCCKSSEVFHKRFLLGCPQAWYLLLLKLFCHSTKNLNLTLLYSQDNCQWLILSVGGEKICMQMEILSTSPSEVISHPSFVFTGKILIVYVLNKSFIQNFKLYSNLLIYKLIILSV